MKKLCYQYKSAAEWQSMVERLSLASETPASPMACAKALVASYRRLRSDLQLSRESADSQEVAAFYEEAIGLLPLLGSLRMLEAASDQSFYVSQPLPVIEGRVRDMEALRSWCQAYGHWIARGQPEGEDPARPVIGRWPALIGAEKGVAAAGYLETMAACF